MKEIQLGYEEAEIYFIKSQLKNDASLMTEDVQEKIEKSVDLLNNYSEFGYKIAEVLPKFGEDGISLDNTTCVLKGKDIYNHLVGSEKIYIFVATLGYGIDRIIRSFEVCDLSIGYYIDTLAGVLVEKLCDYVNSKIALAENGKEITGRFSCGYGDFPLDTQKDILILLNAEKELGIKLTDGGMMTPSKTVSAVIGIGKKGELNRCAICTRRYECKGNECGD